MKRYYYSDSIAGFLATAPETILGHLAAADRYGIDPAQRDAWLGQIAVLRPALAPYRDAGAVYFEYSIPRLGRRLDVVVLLRTTLFVLEFKVGEHEFKAADLDQVWDYALDLKHFHEASHDKTIAPILIATEAARCTPAIAMTPHNDGLMEPIRSNADLLPQVIRQVLEFSDGPEIVPAQWEAGRWPAA